MGKTLANCFRFIYIYIYIHIKHIHNYICKISRSDLRCAAPEGKCRPIRHIMTAYITCYICNMGRSDLPDMYARARGCAVPEGECGHIRQITTAHVTYCISGFIGESNIW